MMLAALSAIKTLLPTQPQPVVHLVHKYLETLLDSSLWEPHQRFLTREEAIGYFLTHRPNEVNVFRGAMCLNQLGSELEFAQVFLDAQFRPLQAQDGSLLGRRMLVDDIDEALRSMFAAHSLVIVE